jgi:hypothetical protein
MAGFTYSTLTTAIQNYTEVGTGVLSSTITDQFIDNSELRIQRDIPIDADRKEVLGNLVASKDNVYAPAGTLFVRGLQVYTSTTAATGANSFLEKKDISFLREYDAAETTTGTPKYYAMSGGATGSGATSSGRITIVPTPSSAFMYKLHYNARPLGLSSANTTTFLSLNFGNGLLYACLVEAFSYLKGPMDMLQLYEQKYQTEAQKFGGEQIGRRRRDDYTDGEPRIPVQSPTP